MKKLIKHIIRFISIGDNWDRALAFVALWTSGAFIVYSFTESFWSSVLLAPLGLLGLLTGLILILMCIVIIIWPIVKLAFLLADVWKAIKEWAYTDV